MVKSSSGLSAFLGNYVSEHKKELIEQVLEQRTRALTVVLEDIYHPHNASAVVRSCDCFGIQDVHVIEDRNNYNINPKVVQGSNKWVDLKKYTGDGNNTKVCFDKLKKDGYLLIGTSPDKSYPSIDDFELNGKTALVFGTEKTGISNYALDNVDALVHIPMAGFTESFNISVCAAICLHSIRGKMKNDSFDWHLTDDEKDVLRLEWYKKVVHRSEVLERKYEMLKKDGKI